MKQRIREYEIESVDDNNYTVSRIGVAGEKSKTPGEETVTGLGYFSQLEHAIKRVAELCGNATENLDTWMTEYRAVINDLTAKFEVTEK